MGVAFDNVTTRYADESGITVALDSLRVRFAPGRLHALLGAPGSGKSTLLQHLNGLLRPDEGRVRIFDFELEPGKPADVPARLRRKAGLVFQYPEQQLFAASVREELLFAPLNHGLDREAAERAALAAADMMGIVPLLEASPLELSSGQQRKTAIAAVLAQDPDLLALDEPTASLDPVSRVELMALLGRLCRERGKTVIVVTHRLEDVLGHADECAVLAAGRLRFQGTPDALLGQPEVMATAGLLPPPAMRLAALLAERSGVPVPPVSDIGQLAAWVAEHAASIGKDAGREGAT